MSVKFFIDETNKALKAKQDECLRLIDTDPAFADEYRRMAKCYQPFTEDYQGREFGIVGPLDAVADALLTMRMTQWELYYAGMTDWKAGAPNYPKSRFGIDMGEQAQLMLAAEDARGVMLMALADRCHELQERIDRAN